MSVATTLIPEVYIPERARGGRARAVGVSRAGLPVAGRPASVTRLYAPPVAATVRLTRRGVLALSALVSAVAVAVTVLAAVSAPAAPPVAPGPATVLVRPGDTLWSIASRVAPDRDPRAEVGDLQRRNGLAGAGLVPGQVLRVR